MIKVIRWCLNRPIVALSFLLIPTVYFISQLPTLRIDTSINAMLDPEDPEASYYEGFTKDFGSDELLFVFFEDPGLFTLKTFRMIDRMTRKFQRIEGIEQVRSLTHFKRIYNEKDDLVIQAIEEQLPMMTEADVLRVKDQLLSDPLFRKFFLISDKGIGSSIALYLKKESDWGYRVRIIREIREVVAEEHEDGVHIYIGGQPVGQVALNEVFYRDMKMLSPLMTLAVMLVLFLVFRRFLYGWLPLLIIGITCIWTFGLVAAAGWYITSITEIVLPLLVVYGVLDSIFFLNDYRNHPTTSDSRRESILKTIERTWKPCFYTSITTAAGFGSLSLSSVSAVQDLGIYCGFGIMACFIITFLVLPICLDRLPAHRIPAPLPSGAFLLEFLKGTLRFSIRYRLGILLGGVIVTSLFGYWMSSIAVDTDGMKIFRRNTEVVRNEIVARRVFNAWAPVEFSVEVVGDGTLENPVLLKEIKKFQVYLESLSEIDRTLSVVDVLERANQEFHGGYEKASLEMPETQEGISRIFGLIEIMGSERELRSYLRQDDRRARVTATSLFLSSREHAVLFKKIQEYVAKNISSQLNIHITGNIQLTQVLLGQILTTEVQSFSIAFLVICLCLIVAFKSWKLALAAVPANIFPVILILGIMGKTGVHLDVGTCTVASIVIGMAVDNTIHFVHIFQEELNQKNDYVEALLKTGEIVGPSLIYTSLLLVGGFWLLTFSNSLPMMNFGLLSWVAVLGALIGNLVILPAFLVWWKPIKVPSKSIV